MQRIVAVCDVFEEGAKKGAEIAGAGTKVYTDFNEAINDPDVNAVVVTTRVSSTRVRFWQRSRPASRYSPRSRWLTPLLTARRSLRPRWRAASTSYRLASCAVTTAATVRSKELIDSGKFGAPMVIKCTHRADGVADDYTTAMAVTDTAIHGSTFCRGW